MPPWGVGHIQQYHHGWERLSHKVHVVGSSWLKTRQALKLISSEHNKCIDIISPLLYLSQGTASRLTLHFESSARSLQETPPIAIFELRMLRDNTCVIFSKKYPQKWPCWRSRDLWDYQFQHMIFCKFGSSWTSGILTAHKQHAFRKNLRIRYET